MKTENLDKHSLLKLTKHLVLAYKHLHKEEEPKFLIKRRFLAYPMQRPVSFQVMEKAEIEKPAAETKEEIFEIGKLTKFTIDGTISLIECSPNQFVKIRKGASEFLTDIKLSEPEIKEIIKKFSEESKTAITPIFRAAAKNFYITAIISSTGSRFIIKRIMA